MRADQEGRRRRWPNSRTMTRLGRTFSICNSRSSWPSSFPNPRPDRLAGWLRVPGQGAAKITLDAGVGPADGGQAGAGAAPGRAANSGCWCMWRCRCSRPSASRSACSSTTTASTIASAPAAATFGILADDDPGWRPGEFRDELLGTELVMRFSTAKLMDYEADWPALENENNPFAVVVMAHAGTRHGGRSIRPAGLEVPSDPPFVRAWLTTTPGRSSACIVSSTG